MPRNSESPVHFFFKDVDHFLSKMGKLKNFIVSLFKKERKKLKHINYIFCTDKTLLKINQQYLNNNYYTDIIGFDLSNSPDEIIADIYISIDRIRDNSKNFKSSLSQELHRVIFHGALHFCGYKDKSNSQKREMKKREDYYLNLYFDS